MAQRKQLTWSELRVGIFVLIALIIVAVAIFYVTGATILGPKYRLRTYLPEVDGLQVGAPVRLDGVDIGSVESIRLNPTPSDRMHNIEVMMRINKRYEAQIRSDSTASLITQGLLGDRYVTISRGLTGSVLPPDGVVTGAEEAAIKQIVERGADVAQNLTVLSQQLSEIVGKIQKGQGTLGKLLTDPSLYNHLNDTVSRVDTLVASVQGGQGTVGKLVASDELYNKADATIDHTDALISDVRAGKGTLGKFVADPSLYNESEQFVSRGNTLLANVQAGRGTIGKLMTDDTLYANLRDASANVRDATAKLNSGQGTLGKFFSDPEFYDNVTGLSGDLRLLIGDFRRNPKKFLHVKLSVF